MNQPEHDPIRKSLLPCTPPPEWEFSTVLGQPQGFLLAPGSLGEGFPVVRRLRTYSDWEPVRPERWADEPRSDVTAAAGAQQPETEERRARYAAALAALADRGVGLSALDHLELGTPDAVMAVADEEQRKLREALRKAQRAVDLLADSHREADRLRAELEQARGTAGPTPCGPPPQACDGETGEPCDLHETARAHAEGDHEYCAVECEVTMPTEMLRNFILAKGYPGTAGALDELLRRAAGHDQPADDVRTAWTVEQLHDSGRWLIVSGGYDTSDAAHSLADDTRAAMPERQIRVVRATTTCTVEGPA